MGGQIPIESTIAFSKVGWSNKFFFFTKNFYEVLHHVT